jgi:hydrogenase maturation protease
VGVLVLGYGNPLRGDDGIGWHAAQVLADTFKAGDVTVLACQELTPDLAEPASRAERVIFIDASVEDEPGCISRQSLQPIHEDSNSFPHDMDPETLLGRVRELYNASPEAVLMTIGAETFDYCDDLSPAVSRGLPDLLQCIRDEIAREK